VLELFNLAHPTLIHGAKGSYSTAGTADTRDGAPVEVDLENGYLAFTEDFSSGVGTRRTVAALFVTDDQRLLLADQSTDARPMSTTEQLTFYEYRRGKAVKLQPGPLPAHGAEAMLVPGASLDELGESRRFAGALRVVLTLPRVGTTIVGRLDTSDFEEQAGAAAQSPAVRSFLGQRLYKRIELVFDTKTGTFSVGAKSLTAK